MALRQPAVQAAIELRLRVPRGAIGDMEQGIRDVLERIDGVQFAEVANLRGVRPSAADLYVDAVVELALAFEDADDPDRVAAVVLDGFGVERVEQVLLDLDA
jgi:hypothetical protein